MPKRSIPHWGWRLDGRTLTRSIDGSRHLLRHPRAIAFDADAYDEWRDRFHDLAVFDRETGITYRTWADNFDLHRGEFDRGFGRQYFAAMQHWGIDDLPPLELAFDTPVRPNIVVPREQLVLPLGISQEVHSNRRGRSHRRPILHIQETEGRRLTL